MADDATFGFAFDTAGMAAANIPVKETADNLKEVAKSAEESGRKLDEHGKKTKETGKAHEEAAKGVREHKKAVEELGDAHQKLTSSSEEARKAALGHRDALKEAAEAAKDVKKHVEAISSYRETGSVHPRHENVGHETSDVRGAVMGINRALNRRRYGLGIAAERVSEFVGDKIGASAMGVAELGAVGVGVSILIGKLVELGQEAMKAADAAQQAQAKFMGLRIGVTGASLYEGVEQDSYRAHTGGDAYRSAAMAFAGSNPALSNAQVRAFTTGAYRLNAASGGDEKGLTGLAGTMSGAIGDGRIDLKELGEIEKIAPQLPALLGQSRVKLDEMAASGKLTAQAFADMMAAAGPGLDKTISDMPDRFHSATTDLKNQWERLLKDMGESSGLVDLAGKIASAISHGMSASSDIVEFSGENKEAAPKRRVWSPNYDKSGFQGSVAQASLRNKVPLEVLETVAYLESRGNPDTQWTGDKAVRDRMGQGAPFGPMQVTSMAARAVGRDPAERSNPSNNADISAAYLRKLYDTTANRNWKRAGEMYVAGAGNVAAGTNIGPRTTAYTEAVGAAAGQPSNDQFYAGLGTMGTEATALGGKKAAATTAAALARQKASEARARGQHDLADNLEDLARQHDEEARQADVEMRNLRDPLTPFGTSQRTMDQRAAGLGDAGISAEARSLQFEQSRAGRPGTLQDAMAMVQRGRVLNVREAGITQRFRNVGADALAAAQLGGPEAVRRAQIDQQVSAQSLSAYGAAGPPTAEAKKALDEFRDAVTKASEATLRAALNTEVASNRFATQGLLRSAVAGGGNAPLLAQRAQQIAARRRQFGAGADISDLTGQGYAQDLNTAGGAIRSISDQTDDLRDRLSLGGMTGDRLRVAQAGQAAERHLSDRTALASTPEGLALIQRAKDLAEGLEKAKIATEHYVDAQKEISGAVSGGAGGMVRGIGGALVRGQLNPHSLDKIVTDQLAGAADKMIDALIAKPVERATEGIAEKAGNWILEKMGMVASEGPPMALAEKAVLGMADAAALATKALASMAATAGVSGGANGFASAFASALGAGGGGGGFTDTAGNAFGENFDTMGFAFGGGVVGGRPVRMAARGALLNRPTMLANGSVLAGEADAEAVMPLKRGPDGKLGVSGGGGGGGDVHVVVNDMRGKGGAPVQTEHSQGPDGRRMIKLTIRDEVRGQISSGDHDNAMRDRFGAQRMITRR